ncbi:IS3 family transposase [Nitrosomonas sp. Nm33]|uniref:IS3 family transposase n=1 Tax=Nitrosomonas sp. Nm33 TaxID=133724 RepID=UPI003524CC2E
MTSMSSKGDCCDNAPMKSFWRTLKSEWVHHQKFKTRLQTKQKIAEYIDLL